MSEYKMTEEQMLSAEWAYVRDKRNKLLQETDWWAVSDRVMSNEEKQYRQDLRDLPSKFQNPNDVIFPSKISKE